MKKLYFLTILVGLMHINTNSSLPNLQTSVVAESEKTISENSMEMMSEPEESYDALSQMQENANSMTTDSIPEPQSFE